MKLQKKKYGKRKKNYKSINCTLSLRISRWANALNEHVNSCNAALPKRRRRKYTEAAKGKKPQRDYNIDSTNKTKKLRYTNEIQNKKESEKKQTMRDKTRHLN